MLDVMVAVLVIGLFIVLDGFVITIVGLLFGNDVRDAIDMLADGSLVAGAVLIIASGALGIVYLVL